MHKKQIRDIRLLAALLLLAVAAAALLIQAWISALYIQSASAQNWTYYLELFPSFARPTVPGAYCLDDCNPYHPLILGLVGAVSFFLGLSVVALSWWKPMSHGSGSAEP